MATRLTEAHLAAQRRLRDLTGVGVGRLWDAMGTYNREDLDRWLASALPLVSGAQRRSAALTAAYIARSLDRPPLDLDVDELIGAAVRNGTAPATVYERPFITVWGALAAGSEIDAALAAGRTRAVTSAATDVQLSMRATSAAAQKAVPEGFYGFQRVANPGACEFCQEVDGAYVKFADAEALHSNCGCALEPLTAPHAKAAKLPSGISVHEHGELGPVLTNAEHHFTTESQAYA